MGNIKSIFGGAFTPPIETPPAPVDQQFADAIRSYIDCDITASDVIADGKIHRFKTHSSAKKNNLNGWYVLFDGDVPGGSFGCWSANISHDFCADIGRKLSHVEQMAHAGRIDQARKIREEADQRRAEAVGTVVDAVWQNAEPASADNAYLERKGVRPHGTKVDESGRLMVPIYNPDGELSSIQYIAADGSKLFHKGGRVQGCFMLIGDLAVGARTVVTEGFATAASIHESTGLACFAALSAGNLSAVAKHARQCVGATAELIIMADNDEAGVGLREAEKAANEVGARVVMPPEVGTDANDFALAGGDIKALINPVVSDFLVHVSEFTKQPAPIQWLIKGWLQRNAMMMLFGPSGAGKSFIAIDWACHIASQLTQWNGCNVRGGTVVYLAGEGHHGMRARLAGWMDLNGVTDLDMYISQQGTDLNTPTGYMSVVNGMQSHNIQPTLIVVDTLHRFLHGDENSAEDAKTMIDACNGLMRDFNCSVMLVHHTGVGEQAQRRGRGSSAWKGALDIEICVTSDGAMQQTKTKDSEPMDDIGFGLVSHPVPGWVDEDGEQVTTAVVSLGQAPKNSKDESKTHEMKNFIKEAWTQSGCDYSDNGLPYISKTALQRCLMTGTGGRKKYSERTASSYANTGGDRDGALLDSGWLIAYRDGFCIRTDCETEASALSMISARMNK